MVNQGRRGARAENEVARELGALGFDMIRSAASKGAADLVAVQDGWVMLIQVKLVAEGKKYAQPLPAERRELLRIAQRCGAFPVIAQRHPGKGGRKPVTRYYRLTGTGPADRAEFTIHESEGP